MKKCCKVWFKALRHMAKEAKLCVTSMNWEEAMANKKYGFGRMSRRELLRTAAAAGVGVAMLPVFARPASAGEATYFTWSGYEIPEMFPGYIQKHGVPPDTALFGDAEEAFQKLRAGYVVDLAHPCSADPPRWRDAGLIQPIDTSRLSNWGGVFPVLKTLEGTRMDGKQWFVPWDWGQTSITYRTDLVDLQGEEESWALLWDERYAGRLSMLDAAEDAWWCTAIYAGIDTDNVTDAGLAKVKDLLVKQRPLLRFYSSDNTSISQALASGELVAAMTWNETAVNLKAEGVPVKFANPKEGALTWVCGLVLHSKAPEPDKAYELIDAMIDPDAGEYLIGEYGYGHSNSESFARLSAERLAELGFPKDPLELLNSGLFFAPQSPDLMTKINRDWEDIQAGA